MSETNPRPWVVRITRGSLSVMTIRFATKGEANEWVGRNYLPEDGKLEIFEQPQQDAADTLLERLRRRERAESLPFVPDATPLPPKHTEHRHRHTFEVRGERAFCTDPRCGLSVLAAFVATVPA